MAIHFNCNKCSHLLQVPDAHAGRKAKCPNCGQIMPIPAQGKPVAKPSASKPPVSKPPAGPKGPTTVAGPLKTAGPIPSLASKKKRTKPAAKKPAEGKPGKEAPPELRSGKKAVIFGVALIGVLVLAVVAWQMDWFGLKKEPEKPKPKRTVTTKRLIEKKPAVSLEEIKARTNQMEQQLAELEKLLILQRGSPEADKSLVETCKALQKYSDQISSQQGYTAATDHLLAQNREWLYGQILSRAQDLVGEYRFASAKKLLDDVLSGESVSGTAATTSQKRRPRTYRVQQTNRLACTELAHSKLIKRGLNGQVCLWILEEADEAGQSSITVSLEPPKKKQRSSRATARFRETWEQKWASVSEHLAFMRELQDQAESRQDVAQAGIFYNLASKLQAKCITFETPGAEDTELLKQLSRHKVDRQIHEQMQDLIASCRYEQALLLAQQLIEENPTNPDNHLWLLRCYLESYNALPLEIELTSLRLLAERAGDLSRYELLNNLLSVGLSSPKQPDASEISQYQQWGRQRSLQLDNVAQYAGEYAGVVDWLKGESRDKILQNLQWYPFLAGEPVDLVGNKGVIYTVHNGGPLGQDTLILAKIPQGQQQRGLYLQMLKGRSYGLWNVYPPADEASAPGRGASKPVFKAVLEAKQINPSNLSGEHTIPILNSLGVLRCEQDSSERDSSWALVIPRGAVHREQLEQDSAGSGRPTAVAKSISSRPPSYPGIPGAAPKRASDVEGRFIRMSFATSRSGVRSTRDSSSNGSQVEPITVLIRDSQTEMAYFTDDKGEYLIGLGGKRFYASEEGLLRTLGENGDGPKWCLALEVKACPERLRKQADYQNPEERIRPNEARLTVSEAASWLSGLVSKKVSRRAASSLPPTSRYSSQRPSSRYGSELASIASRWLDWQGKIIAQSRGQIAEISEYGWIGPLFYTDQYATDLLKETDDYYQASLQSWPTLAGEVYRTINTEKLARMIHRGNLGRAGGTSQMRQGRRLISLNPATEFKRAQRSLASRDLNLALALYGDLMGILSVRLQEAMAADTARGSSRRSPAGVRFAPPGGNPLADLRSRVDQRVRPTARPSSTPLRQQRSYKPAASGGRVLSAEEQFFVEADMLVQACMQRAAALELAGLTAQARRSFYEGIYRIQGYLLADINEWVQNLGPRTSVLPELEDIRQRWQVISSSNFGPGLQRALQAAKGDAMTVPWPNAPTTGQSPQLVLSRVVPVMSLATWLGGETNELAQLSAERLEAVSHLNWVRVSMPIDESGPSKTLSPEQKAERIIELVSNYQASGQTDPATAQALWQLGSFMASIGYPDEAWECLGQASKVYNQLAESLLPRGFRLESQSMKVQGKYYTYRAAALTALAGAAGATGPVWPDSRSLLLGEIQAKLAQIHRKWSADGGSDSLAGILSIAGDAVQKVRDIILADAYEYPRMRFWWWYYPPEASRESTGGSESELYARRTKGPKNSTSSERPKLEYKKGTPKQPRNLRNRSPQHFPPAVPPPGLAPPM